MSITLDTGLLKGFVTEAEISALQGAVTKAHHDLHQKTGAGNDYLGWVDLPSKTPDALVAELTALAREVQAHSKAIISIGIGGSYLGIRSTLEFLGGELKLPVHYAGHNMASSDMARILKLIVTTDVTVVVISKSGATTEPALAFRLVNEAMVKKYKAAELKKRIICVTD